MKAKFCANKWWSLRCLQFPRRCTKQGGYFSVHKNTERYMCTHAASVKGKTLVIVFATLISDKSSLSVSYGNDKKATFYCTKLNLHFTRTHKQNVNRLIRQAMTQIEEWVR